MQSERTAATHAMQAAGVCLAAAWTWWLTCSSVTLYETTDSARIEAEQSAYALQSEVPGRIIAWNLRTGKGVRAGEIIAELDSARERAQLAEMQTRASGLKTLSASVLEQISAEESALEAEQKASLTAEEEARAFSSRASAPASYAEQESDRLKRLAAQGLVSERELQQGIADAAEKRSEVDRTVVAVRRLHAEQLTREQDRRARIRSLQAKQREEEAEFSTALAAISRVQAEIARLVVRAPVTGRVAEAAVLRTGSVVEAGQRLGAIIPDTGNTVVAWFPPAAAGRVRPGQHARIRLLGYPWTEYGAASATVTEVASELRDGKLRAELSLQPANAPRVPLQHGMPGSVEVEVERVSPLVLVKRHVGVLMTRPSSSRETVP